MCLFIISALLVIFVLLLFLFTVDNSIFTAKSEELLLTGIFSLKIIACYQDLATKKGLNRPMLMYQAGVYCCIMLCYFNSFIKNCNIFKNIYFPTTVTDLDKCFFKTNVISWLFPWIVGLDTFWRPNIVLKASFYQHHRNMFFLTIITTATGNVQRTCRPITILTIFGIWLIVVPIAVIPICTCFFMKLG